MEMFPRTLYVAIEETDDAILDFLNGNEGDKLIPLPDSAYADVSTVSDGLNGGQLIRFGKRDEMTEGIVGHECFHAIMRICLYLGIDVDVDKDNEHFAYMLQWAIDKVYELKRKME